MSTPKYHSRQEVAAELRFSLRQVDRIIELGELERLKISTRRSVIPNESLQAYIAKRARVPAVEAFVSDHLTLQMTFPKGFPTGTGRALDMMLSHNFPGVFVAEGPPNGITLHWAWSLAYEPAQIAAEIERMTS